jgi:type VI protein secretion system component Hcp
MPQGSILDILMMMKVNGEAIAGEGTSKFDDKDKWLTGFEAGKFFEIEDFDLGIDVRDKDSTAASHTTTPPPSTGKQQVEKTGQFSTWIQSDASFDKTLYPIEMNPFSLTKQIDLASPVLFKNCFQKTQFDSASLVVRKAQGGLAGNNPSGYGLPFVRINFVEVLLISIDYDCSEVIKEKIKFVTRQVEIKYRAQKPDGSGGKDLSTSELNLKKSK